MSRAAAHALRRAAQALRLVADLLDPIAPTVVHHTTIVRINGRNTKL